MHIINETHFLKNRAENCRPQPKTLAIASGKGGVGKTNIAANLAICLAASQKKVLLMDADLSLGNLDIIMNINSRYNITHMISGKKTLDEIITIGPEGVSVLCAASGIEELANINEFNRQRLVKDLSLLASGSDITIIDTAAGISKSVIGFCLAADEVLVVTTPEPTAITDAYAMIKVLAKNNFSGRISLLVNMAESNAEGRNIYQKIANIVMRFLKIHLYDAGVIVTDEQLLWAIRLRKPVVQAFPQARITASLKALAARITNTAVQRYEERNFFRKVVDLFF